MRPKIRFEVFKRDGFTCVYCGRHAPDVVLEVDHIIPVAEGGGDEYENLISSCWDCNRGKGKGLLDERAPVPDIEERTSLIRERERQLRAYNEAKAEERGRKDADFTEVWDYWFTIWDEDQLPRWHTPWESSLRMYLDKLGKEEVMEAMDIARGRFRRLTTLSVRYYAGICKRKLAEQEGRVRVCRFCGDRIVLTREQIIREHGVPLEWSHTACLEEESVG